MNRIVEKIGRLTPTQLDAVTEWLRQQPRTFVYVNERRRAPLILGR